MVCALSQVGTGGVVSSPVSTTVQVDVFPLPSSAVRVTVSTSLWPFKAVEEAGLCDTVGLPVQLSLTEAGE